MIFSVHTTVAQTAYFRRASLVERASNRAWRYVMRFRHVLAAQIIAQLVVPRRAARVSGGTHSREARTPRETDAGVRPGTQTLMECVSSALETHTKCTPEMSRVHSADIMLCRLRVARPRMHVSVVPATSTIWIEDGVPLA